MTQIATQTITVAGTAPTLEAAAASDTAECGDRLFLIVKNTDAAPVTVTITVPGNLVTGDAFPDKAYTVAALTGEQWIPLLDAYRGTSDNLAAIAYSATTGVTVAVVRR